MAISPSQLRAREGAGAVDAWVRLALAARFDPVLAEALPPDMLAALAQAH